MKPYIHKVQYYEIEESMPHPFRKSQPRSEATAQENSFP